METIIFIIIAIAVVVAILFATKIIHFTRENDNQDDEHDEINSQPSVFTSLVGKTSKLIEDDFEDSKFDDLSEVEERQLSENNTKKSISATNPSSKILLVVLFGSLVAFILWWGIALNFGNLFKINESKAIKLVQETKVEQNNVFAQILSKMGKEGETWQDFANKEAQKEPTAKYGWHAKKTDVDDIYIVDFSDENGWGWRWEVTLSEKIVKAINKNEYLSRKYGLTHLDKENIYQITDIKIDTMFLEKDNNFFDGSKSTKIYYVLKASIINNSDKVLTKADLKGTMKIIFKEKTVESEGKWDSGFETKVSEEKPWKPNTKRNFYIKTSGIDEIYLGYSPEYVLFELKLIAEDPIGYNYDKNIDEIDAMEMFQALKSRK